MNKTFWVTGCTLACACAAGQAELSAPSEPTNAEAEQPDDEVEKTTEETTPKTTQKPEPEEQADVPVPEDCAGDGGCVPPKRWVKKLCNGVYQDVALYMFRKGTPWQRMYMTRETDAINASGGASVAGTLAFDEEVLILRHRGGDSDGIQVSGADGTYDALRWNGSCVSLDASEVRTDVPPNPKTSRVEWRWLSGTMRKALRESDEVNETYRARRKECKGATMGRVSKRCVKLDKKLIDVIVDHVRERETMPQPEDKP